MYNKLTALKNNIDAIRIAWDVCKEQRKATPEEIDKLKLYSGFGGIKEVLKINENDNDNDNDNDNESAERTKAESTKVSHEEGPETRNLKPTPNSSLLTPNYLASLKQCVKNIADDMAYCEHDSADFIAKQADLFYRNIIDSIKNSVLTAFYTPTEVINAVGKAVQHTLAVNGVEAVSLLEPSAGTGGFLPVATTQKKVAFEKDFVSSLVCSALNPDVDVYNDGFEDIATVLQTNDNDNDNDNNKTTKQQNNKTTPNCFDIVASNIPFGDVRVFDKSWMHLNDDVHKQAQQKLHTYFFVKGLEQLENGGILAFVTSRGVADTEGNRYLREWLVQNGHLLAAVRLPDNLFMDGSGIEVGSDLIIFQRDKYKHHTTMEEDFFVESITKRYHYNGENIEVENVNRLLGINSNAIYTDWKVAKNQFGKLTTKYYWRDSLDKLEFRLASLLSANMERRFRMSAWYWGHFRNHNDNENDNENDNHNDNENDNENNKRTKQQNNKTTPTSSLLTPNSKKTPDLSDMRLAYDTLMDEYNNLMKYERENREPYEIGRKFMNGYYDLFVSEFGTLHDNEKYIKAFPEYQRALSLEIRNADKKTYSKADVFLKPVAYTYIDPNKILTPMEALTMSMNEYGKVDMQYICKLTHKTDEEVYEALRGEIYFVAGCDKNGWLPKVEAINGNVIEKRKNIEHWMSMNDPYGDKKIPLLKDTLEALESATPKRIPYSDIDITLGVRWLDCDVFERFAMYIFKCERPTIVYTSANDMYTIKEGRWSSNDEGSAWGKYGVRCSASNRRFSGYDILGYALINKCPEIKYTRYEHTFTDHDGMQLVQKMIDKMRTEFESWIKSNHINKEERQRIEDKYNDSFNCYVRAQYDGSTQQFVGLTFDNVPYNDLYDTQKAAIMMQKTLGGGCIWQAVGAGKTSVMCITAFEMHRLGLCNKPLIIGLKANVAQIADTFRKLYPSGRLLYPGQDDFTAKNRREFFNKIANNDWDCIIMTHDQFGRIPLTPEVQNILAEEEINEIDEALKILHNVGDYATNRQQSGLEKRKQNLQAKMKERKAKMEEKQDDVLNFRQMGIDFVQVDEYQQFKNLAFTSRHKVAGMGNNAGSSRATHLLTCIRDIQMRKGTDMCASFYSGTIITNALTELYVLFKYLCPNALKKQGITCFDAWASTYIKKTTEIELTMTNGLKEKERFRTYLNVPELTQFLRHFTDYRSADMMNLDIPKRNDIFDLEDPTPQQEMMLDRLSKFAGNGDWSELGLPESMKCDNLDKSLMLVVTDLARKIALDPRMLDTDIFHDEPNNKCRRAAKNIYDNYIEFNANKGTQFVFTDLSAYDKNKWNVCKEIRDILVNEYHLPSEEITYINLYESDRAKQKLFEKMNNGEVRVLFGSTQKLGTGVNAQQRAVAVHHLEAPWRPSDLEQRDGRAVRKGNEVKLWGGNEVKIYTYGTKRTLDAYKYNLLTNKALFISQIARQEIGSRHLDEDSVTTEDGITYAELKALLSDNEDLLKMAKLDAKIKVLEAERERYDRQHREANDIIKSNNDKISKLTPLLSSLRTQLDIVKSNVGTTNIASMIDLENAKDSVIPENVITLHGAKSQTVEELGRVLKQVYFDKPTTATCIGQYCGMNIMAYVPMNQDNTVFSVAISGNKLFKCSERGYDMHSLASSLVYFDGLIHMVSDSVNRTSDSITYAEQSNNANKMLLSQEWDGATELMKLQKEYDEISSQVSKELAEQERKHEEEIKKNADKKQ